MCEHVTVYKVSAGILSRPPGSPQNQCLCAWKEEMKGEKGKGMEINGPSKVLEFLTDSKMPPSLSNPSFLHELLGLANPRGIEIIVPGK